MRVLPVKPWRLPESDISVIRNVTVLPPILTNLKAMGIACEQLDENRIVIHPGKPHGCKIKTFEDHRVAMAFAIPGLVTDGIVIENPSCCRKTFENYLKYSIP